MKVVNLRLEDEIVKKLDEISSKFLISRSELIRQAIVMYLSVLENIGFYFKPSVIVPKFDVYEERNTLSIDIGNFSTLSVLNLSYAGIGELDGDGLKADVGVVAKILAKQTMVECYSRFIVPIAALLSTGNNVEYSVRILKELRDLFDFRVILTSVESTIKTRETFISLTILGIRDLKVKNVPKRGDKIFLYGEVLSGEELLKKDGVDPKLVKKLSDLVKEGKASSIFPVKSDGILSACNLAAALAGGKLVVRTVENKGCPATAVIVTAEEMPLSGGIEIGEIV